MKLRRVFALALALLLLSGCGSSVQTASKGSQNYTSTVDKVLEAGAQAAQASAQPDSTPSPEVTTAPVPSPEATILAAPTGETTPVPTPSAEGKTETTPVVQTPAPTAAPAVETAAPQPTPEPVPVAETPEPTPVPEETTSAAAAYGSVDIDLTEMSATLVYSQVYDMVYNSEKFLGKTVRMYGPAVSSTVGGNTYYAVIIQDATACCAQGLEYELQGEQNYPADYDYVTVAGIFDTYREGDYLYCCLRNAALEA